VFALNSGKKKIIKIQCRSYILPDNGEPARPAVCFVQYVMMQRHCRMTLSLGFCLYFKDLSQLFLNKWGKKWLGAYG